MVEQVLVRSWVEHPLERAPVHRLASLLRGGVHALHLLFDNIVILAVKTVTRVLTLSFISRLHNVKESLLEDGVLIKDRVDLTSFELF